MTSQGLAQWMGQQRIEQQSSPNGRLVGEGRPRGKQYPQLARWAERHWSSIRTGEQCNAHGAWHANDEGKDGHDNECHEGTSIHQPRRASLADWLTLYSAGNFFPPSSQVPDVIGGSIWWLAGPAQSFGVIQDSYAPTRSSKWDQVQGIPHYA